MLNAQEEQLLQQLEAEESTAQKLLSQKAPQPLSQRAPQGSVQAGQGWSDDEEKMLQALELEESEAQKIIANPPEQNPEASLGLLNRARFSLEPLETNRRALLIQQYGEENVKQDEQGNLFLIQGGRARPVNAPGISTADFADIAGTLPESLGAGLGAFAGLGVGSVPAAMVGAGAGSAIRQGLSALVGTPQEAGLGERATEVGLSAMFGGAGAWGGSKVKGIAKKMFPKFKMSVEGKKLAQIAKEEGLPAPTHGQLAGGRDLELEKLLGERRIFGRQIRKTVDKQVEAIKKNISQIVGDFVETDVERSDIGSRVKDMAKENIRAIRSSASEMFDEVAEKGSRVTVSATKFKDELLDAFSEIGLFDKAGTPLSHRSLSGLTPDQFNGLQGVMKSILEDVDASEILEQGMKGKGFAMGTGAIDANTVNTMRKFIDSNIAEAGQKQDKVLKMMLVRLRNNFMNVTEDMLGAQDKTLKKKFKTARALWKKQIDLSDIFYKGKNLGISELSDEKILSKVFKDQKSIAQLKMLVSDDEVERLGKAYLQDIISKKIGGQEQIGARGLINTIKEKREALKEALGQETYRKIMNNLTFLDKVGKPVNPSRTYIAELMSDLSPTGLLKGLAETVERRGRIKVGNIVKELPLKGQKSLNILTDETQREAAYFTKGPSRKLVGEKKQKKKKRRPSQGRR